MFMSVLLRFIVLTCSVQNMAISGYDISTQSNNILAQGDVDVDIPGDKTTRSRCAYVFAICASTDLPVSLCKLVKQ
jgi:hypothetical protein